MVLILALPGNAADRPFYGLLHGHTKLSDGRGTPDEAYKSAKAAGLDFFAVTEQNHEEADGKMDTKDGIVLTALPYDELKKVAAKNTKDGQFIALYGQEFSTISSGNHVNLIDAPEHCTVANGDFKTLYEDWLPAHPTAIIQFNHPGFNADQSPKTALGFGSPGTRTKLRKHGRLSSVMARACPNSSKRWPSWALRSARQRHGAGALIVEYLCEGPSRDCRLRRVVLPICLPLVGCASDPGR